MQNHIKIIVLGIIAISMVGCATKRYPIATPLSGAQAELMNCQQLELEMMETEQVRTQITETTEFDWRSVAGFLGDYGIGNAMARSEADTALARRQDTIRTAQARNGCFVSQPQSQATEPETTSGPQEYDPDN